MKTSIQRGTSGLHAPENVSAVIDKIAADAVLKSHWQRYQKKNAYARNISFSDTVAALRKLSEWGELAHDKSKTPLSEKIEAAKQKVAKYDKDKKDTARKRTTHEIE